MTGAEGDALEIVVHYPHGPTGVTTVTKAAKRLGVTPETYRRVLAELVADGYLVPRPDGTYDAAGVLP